MCCGVGHSTERRVILGKGQCSSNTEATHPWISSYCQLYINWGLLLPSCLISVMVITYVFSNCCKSVFYWFAVFPLESDSPSLFLYWKPAHLYWNTSNDSLLHQAASPTVRGHWLLCDLYIPSILLMSDNWCECSSLDNSRHLYSHCSSPMNTYRNSCNTYPW